MRVRVEELHDHGTVWVGIGTDTDSGLEITFAGDWRPMAQIARVLDVGEKPIADVPAWAVL